MEDVEAGLATPGGAPGSSGATPPIRADTVSADVASNPRTLLFTGEDHTPVSLEEATHWVRVYVALAQACSDEGVTNQRFERLSHWLRVHELLALSAPTAALPANEEGLPHQ